MYGFQEDFRNFWSECPWEEDLGYAEAVCRQAGVELRVVHLTDEYWGRVVSHCVSEIQAGRTPNPDILCNSRVKFGAFYDRIDFAEFDRVASGHYARLERGPEGTRLALCADEVIPRNLKSVIRIGSFHSSVSTAQAGKCSLQKFSVTGGKFRRVSQSATSRSC